MLSSLEELKNGLESSRLELMKNVEASIVDGNSGGATKQAEMAIKISEEIRNIERLSKLAIGVEELQKKRKEAIIRRDANKQKIDDEEKDLKVKLEELKKEPDSKKEKLESDREKLVKDVHLLVKEAKSVEASQIVREATKISEELKQLALSRENETEIQQIENRLDELSAKRLSEDKEYEKISTDLIVELLKLN